MEYRCPRCSQDTVADIGGGSRRLGADPQSAQETRKNMVGGIWVKKPDELLDVLAAGRSGYHFFDTLADRIVIEKADK